MSAQFGMKIVTRKNAFTSVLLELWAPQIYVVKNQSLHKIYYINLEGP